MEACGNYQQFLQTVQTPDAPRLVTRPLNNSSLVITEIKGPAGFGPTGLIAPDNAYVLQLRLLDCPKCTYFLAGKPLPVADRGAGALQFHDLRAAPSAVIHDPFHVMHLYMPQAALSRVAEEYLGRSLRELTVVQGECYRDDTVKNLLLALRPVLARPQEASALLVEHITQSICVHLVQSYTGPAVPPQGSRGGLAAWQAKRARELIERHLNEDIPLSRLAAECGLSVRHFTRAFTQSFGMPAHRYLTRRRIELALELLKIRTLSIPEIALACGFVDQSHLTRVFASHIGSNPGHWRRTRHGGC
jgi:AraC family transcriptional regulator